MLVLYSFMKHLLCLLLFCTNAALVQQHIMLSTVSARIKKLVFRVLSESLTFKAGDRFPYVGINHKGEMVSCYNLLAAAKFHLLYIGTDSNGNEKDIPKAFIPLIRLINLPVGPGWLKLGVRKKYTFWLEVFQAISLMTAGK